jgi:hypothetical protein
MCLVIHIPDEGEDTDFAGFREEVPEAIEHESFGMGYHIATASLFIDDRN